MSQQELTAKLDQQKVEWEKKLADNMKEFESQVSQLKQKFEKDLAEVETKKTKAMAQEKEKFSKQMQNVKEDINAINKLHDQEVQNVFEDEKTLGFIQKMRGFKKNWQQNKAITKRKTIAGQMAEATKNWISSYE